MPNRPRNSDSWFCEARLAAGFTIEELAQNIGKPKITVWQWELGSEGRTPSNRPPWRYMLKLRDLLRVDLSELVEHLWRERVGETPTCGCGKKILNAQPNGRMLAVEVPCARCGKRRIYYTRKHKAHRPRCESCRNAVELMKFHCIGPNAGERRPDTCRGDIELRPCDINHLERQKERRNEHRSWGSFFDPLAGTYRCLYCQGATNAPALVQKQWEKIEELLRKKHEKERPRHEQFPRLRKSEAKRRRYVKEHWRELYPNFKIDHEAREEGRRKPSLKRSLARKKASLLYWWNGENSRLSDRLGLCVFCNKLQINRIGQPARFHWRCYSHWVKTSEGRAYVSLRRQGKKPSLPIRKREAGRSVTEEALKTSFATALLHYFMGKSYREIAEKYGIDYRTAYYRVDEFFENLPDDLSFLPDSFSETVEMLIEERARERAAVPQAPAESA